MKHDANTIFNFLKEAILELKDIEPNDFTMDTELASVDLDSLDLVDIQVNIRREYGVQLPAGLFADGKINTFGQLASYIASHAAVKQQEREVAAA